MGWPVEDGVSDLSLDLYETVRMGLGLMFFQGSNVLDLSAASSPGRSGRGRKRQDEDRVRIRTYLLL